MDKQDIIDAIAVMQAWVNGEPIQCMTHFGKTWIDVDNPAWDWYNDKYRVKPQVKYRPYSSEVECMHDILTNHSNSWMKVKDKNTYFLLKKVSPESNFDLMFRNWEYIDGSPFGMKITK